MGGREETDSPKTPFWTTVSPHDTFAAPLAHSDLREVGANPTVGGLFLKRVWRVLLMSRFPHTPKGE